MQPQPINLSQMPFPDSLIAFFYKSSQPCSLFCSSLDSGEETLPASRSKKKKIRNLLRSVKLYSLSILTDLNMSF